MNLREHIARRLPDFVVRGKATSTYTAETIQKRLTALEGRTDDEANREREYLTKLLAKL